MSDARQDIFEVLALLADLDKVAHPLARPSRGDFRVDPTVPPPLPPTGLPHGPETSGGGRSLSPVPRAAPPTPHRVFSTVAAHIRRGTPSPVSTDAPAAAATPVVRPGHPPRMPAPLSSTVLETNPHRAEAPLLSMAEASQASTPAGTGVSPTLPPLAAEVSFAPRTLVEAASTIPPRTDTVSRRHAETRVRRPRRLSQPVPTESDAIRAAGRVAEPKPPAEASATPESEGTTRFPRELRPAVARPLATRPRRRAQSADASTVRVRGRGERRLHVPGRRLFREPTPSSQAAAEPESDPGRPEPTVHWVWAGGPKDMRSGRCTWVIRGRTVLRLDPRRSRRLARRMRSKFLDRALRRCR